MTDWDLLHRYLAGECTPEERARFEAWRDASPERQALVASLLEATGEPPALPLFTERDRTGTWARLEESIASAGESDTETPAPRPTAPRVRTPSFAMPARRWGLARAAAAAILILGGAAVGHQLWQMREPAPAATVADRVLQTPRGQRATFQLVDGTRVILGPASTLRYAADYGRNAREVRVEGEAYFEVTHDEHRPFVVHAADLVAEDLGTEFAVRAYPEDAHARVVVREGEVGIRAATAVDATVRVLTPGQLGRLTARGEPVVETVELDSYFAWTEGRLVFDGVPLREALPQLGRWFDLELKLADRALGNIPITATLEQRPTPEVLGNVAAALGLTYVHQGDTVIFRATGSRD